MAEASTAGVNGAILAGVLRFTCSLEVRRNPIAETGIGRVMWEGIGEFVFETVVLTALQRLARVGMAGTANAVSEGVDFHTTGFVKRSARRGRVSYDIVGQKWGRKRFGDARFDMRGDGVHHEAHGENVIKVPLWVYSNAADAFQHIDTQHSINSSHWVLANVTQAR